MHLNNRTKRREAELRRRIRDRARGVAQAVEQRQAVLQVRRERQESQQRDTKFNTATGLLPTAERDRDQVVAHEGQAGC